MFKISNRNTRKRCLLISKTTLKTSERRLLTASYFSDITVQNHISDSFSKNIYQFAIKSLLSVLLSSSTVRNFNNSKPIYVIIPYMSFYEKWKVITEIFDSSKIQNVSIFYFRKNSPQNWQIFQLFILYFSITKLDILIFSNIPDLEMDFWNLSWKRIVSSPTFWKKFLEKHYKWDIAKNGIAYSTARNLKTTYLWNFHFH